MPSKPGAYSATHTRPDPMDPNDRVRQQTHSRSGTFPYDRPVSYGADRVPDPGGAAREVSYGGQLTPWFMPDDDGDIEQEAIGTPINFRQSDGGGGSGAVPLAGQSRGWAGSNKDNLDIDTHWDVFGEDSFRQIRDDLRDLQTGELRDISMSMGLAGQGLMPVANQQPAPSLVDALHTEEDLWPSEVRSMQLRSLDPIDEYEDMSLGECFAVYNPEGDEVISLLETLDWER